MKWNEKRFNVLSHKLHNLKIGFHKKIFEPEEYSLLLSYFYDAKRFDILDKVEYFADNAGKTLFYNKNFIITDRELASLNDINFSTLGKIIEIIYSPDYFPREVGHLLKTMGYSISTNFINNELSMDDVIHVLSQEINKYIINLNEFIDQFNASLISGDEIIRANLSSIILTEKCYNYCRICGPECTVVGENIDFDKMHLFFRTNRNLLNLDEIVCLSGGDPFLYNFKGRQIQDVIEMLKNIGYSKFEIVTLGWNKANKEFEKIFEEISKIKDIIIYYVISLNPYIPSLNKTIYTLHRVMEYYQSRGLNIKPHVLARSHPFHFDKMKKLVDELIRIFGNRIFFSGNPLKNEISPIGRAIDIFNDVGDYFLKHSDDFSKENRVDKTYDCRFLYTRFNSNFGIGVKGHLTLCKSVGKPPKHFYPGNLFKEPFLIILSRIAELYDQHMEKLKETPEHIHVCEYHKSL